MWVRYLDECIELIRAGATVEECLERFPDESEELDPLLRTAFATWAALSGEMPSETRSRVRVQVMAEWDRDQVSRKRGKAPADGTRHSLAFGWGVQSPPGRFPSCPQGGS